MLSTEWEDVVHPPSQQTQSKSTSVVFILIGSESQIPRRQSPLIPISVNHLLKCDVDDSGHVLVYNNATSIICIVGRLFSVETKANCSYFSIHDGTAGIVARYWSFDTDNTNQLQFGISLTHERRVDHYVRVIGIAKKYKTGLSINVQHINAISSYDALLVHWLEVIQTARALSVQQVPRAVNPQTLRSVVPPRNRIDQYVKPAAPPPPLDEIPLDVGFNEVPLTETQKKVLNVIQQFGLVSTEGVSMQTILQNARLLRLSDADIVWGVDLSGDP